MNYRLGVLQTRRVPPAGPAEDGRHDVDLRDQVVDASQVILLNLDVCSPVNQQLLRDEGDFVNTPLQPPGGGLKTRRHGVIEIVSQSHPVEVVLHIGHLESEGLQEVSVRRLSDFSQL